MWRSASNGDLGQLSRRSSMSCDRHVVQHCWHFYAAAPLLHGHIQATCFTLQVYKQSRTAGCRDRSLCSQKQLPGSSCCMYLSPDARFLLSCCFIRQTTAAGILVQGSRALIPACLSTGSQAGKGVRSLYLSCLGLALLSIKANPSVRHCHSMATI